MDKFQELIDEGICLDSIEISQPIGKFYISKIDWSKLISIAKADIRRIEKEESREIETYLGIQRKLSQNRLKEIGEYVRNYDASFPTSVILHVKSVDRDDFGEVSNVNAFYDPEKRKLYLRKSPETATILDGQHRIEGLRRGLANSHENSSNFDLNLTIFIDLDMEDQSMLFATVNKAQTKVNKSLVYDLFDFAKSRSPQRTAHNIVRLMNEEQGSPFQNRVKILGPADDKEYETITQATLVELILKYISRNPMKDRDLLIRGKKLERPKTENEKESLFLRNFFINKEDTAILKILWNYFKAVDVVWNAAWNKTNLDKGFILNKSTGVIALMRFLKPLYKALTNGNDRIIEQVEVERILYQVSLEDNDFTSEKFKPGGTGQSELYKIFVSVLD